MTKQLIRTAFAVLAITVLVLAAYWIGYSKGYDSKICKPVEYVFPSPKLHQL